MDELELLKKDWKNAEKHYPSLSHDEIYKMTHSKSSSIVKWIFYISLIELGLGLILALVNPRIDNEIIYPTWLEAIGYFTIPVLIYFIVMFYKNYKSISATDNVRKLIKNILKTRKTVKYYVLFNLIFTGIFSAIAVFIAYIQASGGYEKFNETAHFKEYAILVLVIVLFSALFIAIAYGLYYLLYGILLKRLNRNYDELKKLEV
ncbi:hypothetical protein [Winogradskyella flava]|uniref:Uncharacterized protein n=1 Tax=Winogradskyella flava TaxID=1884876 RepID=A0A842IYF3_9FLAO|nr:hypothetical protein [Winogradskyella flava]MBC2845798.1 hypothetical protein [Winogradskyella flava]